MIFKRSFRHKTLFFGLLIFGASLVFSSCSTSGKAGKGKRCDCPRWSYNESPAQPEVNADEKI
jgi:hypothetical protein